MCRSQFKYMATQTLVFLSKSNVLFMMFDCGCVHARVYLHIGVCMGVHLCGFMCMLLFNYPAHVTSPSQPPCFSFTKPAPGRRSVGGNEKITDRGEESRRGEKEKETRELK